MVAQRRRPQAPGPGGPPEVPHGAGQNPRDVVQRPRTTARCCGGRVSRRRSGRFRSEVELTSPWPLGRRGGQRQGIRRTSPRYGRGSWPRAFGECAFFRTARNIPARRRRVTLGVAEGVRSSELRLGAEVVNEAGPAGKRWPLGGGGAAEMGIEDETGGRLALDRPGIGYRERPASDGIRVWRARA